MREEVLYEIFLDIHKAYGNLDPDLYLNTLVVYAVGPWSLCLLRHYWARLMMVARDGAYFGTPFKGYHGVNQGYPLSPTIFNVVIDAVLQHWVTVVALTE